MNLSKGLAGVPADTTSISEVDGERGELRYRGYAIADLVARCSFLDVVGLVLDGELPQPAARVALDRALAQERALPPAALAVLTGLPRDTHPMTALQIVVPLLDSAAAKSVPRLGNRAAQRELLLAIASRIPTAVAAWARIRNGRAPLPPDPSLAFHADFLRMVRGEAPHPREVTTLDATQILQMEHGFNASTFAGRTIASTLCPLSMALSACVGALFGPLHGGADEAAYRMALSIADPAKAPAWVDAQLAAKEKIMGLGHREYKVVDPRAVILKPMALELARLKEQESVVETLIAVDEHAEKRFAEQGKKIKANVEFYKGAVFAALGIPPEFFTTLFVMGRVFGWGAHMLELWDDHKLYRPAAVYTGAGARTLE